MMKKFLFLISMTNPIRYATLLSLMMFLSNYAYGSHAAGLDLTYQCISGGSISGVQITVYDVAEAAFQEASVQSPVPVADTSPIAKLVVAWPAVSVRVTAAL